MDPIIELKDPDKTLIEIGIDNTAACIAYIFGDVVLKLTL